MKPALPCLAALLALSACNKTADVEETPGAAARYLDNVVANETPDDRAAIANGADEKSPSSGASAPSIGQAPVFSREPVAPRR